MKRVMHCIASLAVGGVEARVLNAFEHFTNNGRRHDHLLCAFRGGKLLDTHVPAVRAMGVPCHVLDRPSRYSLAFCGALKRLVDDVRPDIIHAYNSTAALWTRLLVGGRRDTRIIVHCGGVGGLTRLWRTIERGLLPRSDAFVFNSQSTRAVWDSFLPIRCPARVIHNGVTFSEESKTDPPAPPAESSFTLLTVCRMVPVKALDTQIDAVKVLHDGGHTDIRLMIVGDGPLRPGLEARVKRLGLESAVSFEGFQSDPRRYHHRAHVYLGTSYNETFGMTLAAAMFDRMICIAAGAGGPCEIIEDGKSGFLLPCTEPLPDHLRGRLPTGQALPTRVYDGATGRLRPPLGVNPRALADKILDVRSRYRELSPIRHAAHNRIADHFSVSAYCRSLEALYDELP